MTELITQTELADMLKVTRFTIIAWQNKGVLPQPIMVGNTTRYDMQDIKEWLEANKRRKPEATTASE